MSEEYKKYRKIDLVKDIIVTVLMAVLFYAYWLAILLIVSLFLMNIWKTSLLSLCAYSGLLAGISIVVYVVRLITKRSGDTGRV